MAAQRPNEEDPRLKGLLHYRPWRGRPHSAVWAAWPIARHALSMMLRRKSFWALYALALLTFFMFFFGQYMLFWAQSQAGQSSLRVLGKRTSPAELIELFREKLNLNGSGVTYRTFYVYQGYVLMVVMALGGAMMVGNDFRYGSLPFYLSKPIAPRHYLLGKGLAIAILVNLTTTIPAVILFVQYGLLDSYDYFGRRWKLLGGIIGYGALLTVVLTLLLLAAAVRLRKTVPLVMTWTALFFFLRRLTRAMVNRLNYDPRCALLDLWNDVTACGNYFLGLSHRSLGRQPPLWEAGMVLALTCTLCLIYLIRRVRAVEIVR